MYMLRKIFKDITVMDRNKIEMMENSDGLFTGTLLVGLITLR